MTASNESVSRTSPRVYVDLRIDTNSALYQVLEPADCRQLAAAHAVVVSCSDAEVEPHAIFEFLDELSDVLRRKSLKVTDVQPNHGWRHLWREIVRGTRMKPELCDYMCGHESKSGTGARYGKRKVPVLAKEMSLFPRFDLPALSRRAVPHKRTRRTLAELTADEAAKTAHRSARERAA